MDLNIDNNQQPQMNNGGVNNNQNPMNAALGGNAGKGCFGLSKAAILFIVVLLALGGWACSTRNGFVNQAGHGVKLFRISASGTVSQYNTLYNCFWNENFWDGYRNAKWNPLSGVLSFHVMPCEPTDTNGLPTAFTTNEQISICGLELKYVLDPGPPITELKATGDMPYHTKAQLRTGF